MNRYPQLDKDIQRDFYYHVLPKAKRYGTWNKSGVINKNVELLMEYYQVNRVVAESYLNIMSDDAVKTLKEKLHTGGSK